MLRRLQGRWVRQWATSVALAALPGRRHQSGKLEGQAPDTRAVESEADVCHSSGGASGTEDGVTASKAEGAQTGRAVEAVKLRATAGHANEALLQIVRDATPVVDVEDIRSMLKGAKNETEVRRVLEQVVYRHHLCFDLLNGHGFRVAVVQAVTSVAPHTWCMKEWFDCVDKFRRLGFILTRTYAAEGFTTIRQWLSREFNVHGRAPHIVSEGIAHIRELMHWCHEDALVFDHVLYTRIIFLLTLIVSYFDRQNLMRASFPAEFAKRDGIVVEWVIGPERCVDFDECVLQCDAFMEEVLAELRHDIPTRASFSVCYRLMDYYFATDNVEKMLAVMEDAQSYGVNVAESSTAKLMQLACAFNYPQVPELFLRWRVALPHCVLATPDMSRLLFYYSRAGGGRPCPVCGEPYNHRNVSVYRWRRTPPHQRECPALRLAMRRKGELEECVALPQNADSSATAFQLWELSAARAVEWGSVEWRGFLLCCLFSPRALEARALLDAHLDHANMDDYLRATYMRLLRHHAPMQAMAVLDRWLERGLHMSPIALQEGLMAAVLLPDRATRLRNLKRVWQTVQERDTYVMPFTRRFIERRRRELGELNNDASDEEQQLLQAIIDMKPRRLSLLDAKDSASDLTVGTTRKHRYVPPRQVHISAASTRPSAALIHQ